MFRIFGLACLLLTCSVQQSDSMEQGMKEVISPNPQKHIPGVTYEKLQEVFQPHPKEREGDRYFSLRDVVADEDKVVTGLRIRKVDHVFYIQIQQATLGPNRRIVGQVEWKDIETVNNSILLSNIISESVQEGGKNLLKFHKNNLVYAITSQQNTVLLDDVEAGRDHVVTGLRFYKIHNDLRLEIQGTPFDDETGELDKSDSQWVHYKINKKYRAIADPSQYVGRNNRVQIVVNNLLGKSPHKLIKFQVADFGKDLGKNTVPLIDIQDVTAASPQPLFGAGIVCKGNSPLGGFLALKGMYDQPPNNIIEN